MTEVYATINKVHTELAKAGIAKGDTNSFDHYKFRGIDSVYNAVSPILAKHGLLILQRVLDNTQREGVSSQGKPVYFTLVKVEFDLIDAKTGSKHTITTIGEGMDRSDKSANKALTAAYKYALFQAFCIPTESTDPDQETIVASSKPVLVVGSPAYEKACNHYMDKGNIDAVKNKMVVSDAVFQSLVEDCLNLANTQN